MSSWWTTPCVTLIFGEKEEPREQIRETKVIAPKRVNQLPHWKQNAIEAKARLLE